MVISTQDQSTVEAAISGIWFSFYVWNEMKQARPCKHGSTKFQRIQCLNVRPTCRVQSKLNAKQLEHLMKNCKSNIENINMSYKQIKKCEYYAKSNISKSICYRDGSQLKHELIEQLSFYLNTQTNDYITSR